MQKHTIFTYLAFNIHFSQINIFFLAVWLVLVPCVCEQTPAIEEEEFIVGLFIGDTYSNILPQRYDHFILFWLLSCSRFLFYSTYNI